MRDASREERLADLVDRFLAEGDADDPARRAELADRHPELADELLELLGLAATMRSEEPSDESPTDGFEAWRPRAIGGYRIERELGRGGMGAVFLATEENLGRRVALKLLPSQAALDPRRVERFRREARAAATLEHPHIVPVFGTGHDGNLHYIVMKFVEGAPVDRVLRRLRDGAFADGAFADDDVAGDIAQSLAELVEAGGDAYHRRVATIGRDVADALEHAHSKGILHRDVKPGNLLVSAAGHVWVTDFGLCRTNDVGDLTRSEDVVGTLRYMAPEQVDGEATVASDVFSLGVTLWELVVRRTLHDGAGRRELLQRVLAARVSRARTVDRDVPRDLEAILAKATAEAPGARYPTAAALRDDLDAYLHDRPVQARVPGTWDLLRLAYRRNRPLAWTLAGTLVAVVALTVAYVASLHRARAVEQYRLYRASLSAAVAKVAERDPEAARAALEDAPAALRGWEWRHLAARLDRGHVLRASGEGLVLDVDVLPGGRYLAAIGRRAVAFDERRTLLEVEHASPVESVAHARDLVASVDTRGRLRLTELSTGASVADVTLESGALAVNFSRDGTTLAVGHQDGVLRTYGRDGRSTGVALRGHSAPIQALVPLPDGGWVSSGSDHRVLVWAPDGTTRSLVGHEGMVYGLDLDPAGRRLVSSGTAGRVHVWDLDSGARVASLRLGSMVTGAVFAGRSDTVVLACDDRVVRRWTPGGDDATAEVGILPLYARSLAWSEAERRVLSGSIAGTIQAWDPWETSGHHAWTAHVADVHCVDASPTGDLFLSAGRDGFVALWRASTGRLVQSIDRHTQSVWGTAWSGDGATFASFDLGGRIVLGSLDGVVAEHAPRGPVDVDEPPILDVAFSRTAVPPRLYVARGPEPLELLALPALAELDAEVQVTGVSSVAVAPNSPHVLLGFLDGRIEVREERDLSLVRAFEGHEARVSDLVFDVDGARLVSTGHDGRAVVWDWRAGEAERVLRVTGRRDVFLSAELLGAAFHPDGTRLALTARGGSPSLWDVERGEPLIAFGEVRRWASTADFTADGTALVCGSYTGEVHVWKSTATTRAEELDPAARERHAEGRRRSSRAGVTAELLATWSREDPTPEELDRARTRAYCLFHVDRADPNGRYLYGRSIHECGEHERALGFLLPLVEVGHPDLREEHRREAERIVGAFER